LLKAGIGYQDGSIEGRDKVAVLSNNRPEWLILDLAVQQNYQMSLSDFLYGRSDKSHIRGLVSIYKILNKWLNL
jgi:hypothetical protein